MRNIILILCTLVACGCVQTGQSKEAIERLEAENESLKERVVALEGRINKLDSLVVEASKLNVSNTSNIKDVEDDLESVITFLGNEFGY